MDLSNEQLICEAVECNHAGVGSSTLERYRDHLAHFAQYLASIHKSDFYKANKKQVRLFMGHLEKQGGATPDPARLRCDWCRARNYPNGREGPGCHSGREDRRDAGGSEDYERSHPGTLDRADSEPAFGSSPEPVAEIER